MLLISAHLNEDDDLHEAPQALKVCVAANDQKPAGSGEKDGKASERFLDIVLIDAVFVNPQCWFLAIMLLFELLDPLLQGCPLCITVITPRVGHKGINTSQLAPLRVLAQLRVRCVLCL